LTLIGRNAIPLRAGLSRGGAPRDALQSLRRIVDHAYRRVPFYRERMDAAGLRPRDVRSAADLAALPPTSKSEIRALPRTLLLASGVDVCRLHLYRTTGSTGEPLDLLRSKGDDLRFHLFRMRAMRFYGIKARDRMALVSTRGHGHPAWNALQRAGVYRQSQIFLLDPPERIADRILAERPDLVTGNAAVLARVAAEISARRGAYRPRFVVSGSEMLTPFMRRDIEAGFAAPLYDTYGSEEMSLIAWQCPEAGLYHVSSDSVLVEVLGRDGRPVREGARGEVVATALHFYAMPFIRFRLDDEAVLGPGRCPCGRPFPTLAAIAGRATDYFRLPGGREVFASALAYVVHARAPWIRRYQVAQESETRVVLRAVPVVPPGEVALGAVREGIEAILGPGVEFAVEIVREIEPEPGGKHRVFRTSLGSPYDAGS
jgi:phenylacetate-CoA ligase